MRHTIALLAGVSFAALLVGTATAQTPPGVDTSAYILENLNGKAAPLWDAPGGIPVTTVYSAEGKPFTLASGTGANDGNVLVDANGVLVVCGTGCGSPAQAGDKWVSAGNTDPTNSYKWVPATYGSVGAAADLAPLSSNPSAPGVIVGGAYAAGDYVVNADGKLVVANNVNCASAAQGCTFVAPSGTDATAGKNLPFEAAANTGIKGITSPSGDATTTFAGGTTYANGKSGASTAVGTGGIAIVDKNGNTGNVSAGGAAWTSSAGSVVIDADPSVTVTNANGYAKMQANGTTIGFVTADTHGNQTAVTPTGLTTTGTVTANTLTDGAGTTISGGVVTANAVGAGVGSFGTLYAGSMDVGATLVSYGDRLNADDAAIKMLGGQVAHAQDTANKALSAAAITAALPQLHFAPGDWLSVGVGGADAGGTGAWSLAAGALVRPNIMLNIKGGMSGNTGVIAGGGSISFGGGYSPLK